MARSSALFIRWSYWSGTACTIHQRAPSVAWQSLLGVLSGSIRAVCNRWSCSWKHYMFRTRRTKARVIRLQIYSLIGPTGTVLALKWLELLVARYRQWNSSREICVKDCFPFWFNVTNVTNSEHSIVMLILFTSDLQYLQGMATTINQNDEQFVT